MSFNRWILAALAVTLSLAGCSGSAESGAQNIAAAKLATTTVTITSGGKSHKFSVEVAATKKEQRNGLMFRTDIGPDQGMLFYPYPPEGGPPREATFWMKDTPTSLDIVYIRPNGTIARIAENAVPYSEDTIPSGEPVGAVLELLGGRTSELGISPDDRVSWPGYKPAS